MAPTRLRATKTQGLLRLFHLYFCCLVLKCGYIYGPQRDNRFLRRTLKRMRAGVGGVLCVLRGRLLVSSEEPESL